MSQTLTGVEENEVWRAAFNGLTSGGCCLEYAAKKADEAVEAYRIRSIDYFLGRRCGFLREGLEPGVPSRPSTRARSCRAAPPPLAPTLTPSGDPTGPFGEPVDRRDGVKDYDILRFFESAHLPEKLLGFGTLYDSLANQMADELPRCAEAAAGLRKLLEAKDCFVRAKLLERHEEVKT